MKSLSAQDRTAHIIQQAVTHVLMDALYSTFIIIRAACIICRLKDGSRNVIYDVTGKSISVANVKGFGDKVMFTVIESNKDDKGIIRVKSRGIIAYSIFSGLS